MTIEKIIEIIDAELISTDSDTSRDVHSACGSDMMSDVLAYVKDQAMLITGLVNPQVVRTASMMDMVCVVFARGKRPGEDILQLAKELDIVLLGTKHTLFTTCGLLYQSGLRGGTDYDKR